MDCMQNARVGSTVSESDGSGRCVENFLRGMRLLLFVSAVKLVVEIALMALAGQFVLGLLAGAKRDSNFFYRVLQVVTGPVLKGMRLLTPRVVLDRHMPIAAFVLLASIWLVATMVKIDICLRVGIEQCR